MAELPTIERKQFPELYAKYQKGLEFFGKDYIISRLRQLENKRDKTKKIVVDLKRKTLVDQQLMIKVLRDIIARN
ncbi:hypothetical protein COT47_06630 [Candidatus Woesearchaeota archaeon CG08_land_8_20_14_0_20_43_7]|nr:MAG: hypothetical protein COT47_06630 [Candidatus Woesearchaeota archaeon CG08_land_8_20_14_0_20_43_7]